VTKDDVKWILVASSVLISAIALLAFLIWPFGAAGGISDRFGASLTFLGGALTAGISILGLLLKRQSERRLAIEASIQAVTLLVPREGATPSEDSNAAVLLTLTHLGQYELAVTLLGDLWSYKTADQRNVITPPRISTHSAILVIDAALRNWKSDPNVAIIAAEMLARNAEQLDFLQALHWPASIDRSWNPMLDTRVKLLLLEAMLIDLDHETTRQSIGDASKLASKSPFDQAAREKFINDYKYPTERGADPRAKMLDFVMYARVDVVAPEATLPIPS
jgi:hypothetical protein